MSYNATDDPYIDPDTGVLKNLLGISDPRKLAEVEASLTVVAIASLKEQPIAGKFDLAHLRAIHRRLFGSIFEWAGQLRTVEMDKGNTRFANADFLEQAADSLFKELHSENLLDGLNDEKYSARLAHYYSEVNILHPFREGNGRAQRAFCTLLTARSGRSIKWDKMNLDDNLAASIKAHKGDESDLAVLLGLLIVKN